jgi:hypothetical protein
MIQPSELDMAQLRHEFRQLYRMVGYESALQIFCEMLIGASAFGEIILEERRKERKGD